MGIRRIWIGYQVLAAFLTILLAAPHANGLDKIPVWIDTDPACGLRANNDVDDCWALLVAINSLRFDIIGVSTVYGNVPIDEAHISAQALFEKLAVDGAKVPQLFKGAVGRLKGSEVKINNAVHGLYSTLQKRKLTILALGPLTNIALLIQNYPAAGRNIKEIIAVAGNRPDQRLFFIGQSKIVHFHDLNFKKDPAAFEMVLNSKIPLTLLPFEVAEKITLTAGDLEQMGSAGITAGWLAEDSMKWLGFWDEQFKVQGFYPFDCLAVGYLLMPDLFECNRMKAQIKWRKSIIANRSELQVQNGIKSGGNVTYCHNISASFKESLLGLL